MAGSFQGALASIPGLGGYLGGEEQDRIAQMSQLQQAGALQGILAKNQDMQNAPLRTKLLAAQVAEHEQAPDLKRIGLANNREATLSRLKQSADQFDQKMLMAWKEAGRKEDKDAIEAQWKQGRLDMEATAQRMTGERLFYDTGTRITPTAAPQLGAPQQGALSSMPPVQGALSSTPQLGEGMAPRTQAPDMTAALAQFAGGGGAPRTVEVATPPAAAPVAQPVAAPVQPQGALSELSAVSQPPAAPNNLDARDLRMRGAAAPSLSTIPNDTVGTGTDLGTPMNYQSPPEVKPKPPEYASWPKKVKDAYDSKQAVAESKASIAGGGVPSKETALFVARQYLNGNDQALSGYARSVPAKLVIMDAIRSEAESRGLKPEDVNARIAEFQGTKAASRSVGTRAAGISMAAEEAQQAIQVVKDTSVNFDRGNFVPWNYALKAYDTNTGRPEVVQFGAAINALVNTYARALNPTGVAHQADKDHARALLSAIQSPAQVDGVLKVINRELEIAKRAPAAVKQQIRESVTGGSGGNGAGGVDTNNPLLK